MISYIVVVNDFTVLRQNLLATIKLADGDELIIVTDAKNIFEAYNRGIARAKNMLKCFVHQDVRILNPDRLRALCLTYATAQRGIVGVIGSTNPRAVPWWEGEGGIGSVIDAGLGVVSYNPAGGPCALLDGLFLATAQPLTFDEGYSWFHFYDHDLCQQALARGLKNYCLPEGHTLIMHNTARKNVCDDTWRQSMERYKRKWGLA